MNVSVKRLGIALAVSVALNLFVGGFFAARMFHSGPWQRREPAYGPFFGPRGMMRGDRGEGAEAMHAIMQRNAEAFRTERGRLRQAQQAVHGALAAEPFDAPALERALADLRATTADSQKLMHTALVELARSLPAEQRRRIARQEHGFGGGRTGPGGF